MSEVKTNKISPSAGLSLTLGDSGDTITIPAGAILANSGTATGFGTVGGLVHLHTTTISSIVSEVQINDVFNATYSNYRIAFQNLVPDTNNNTLYIGFKENSGATQLNMHSITRYFGVNAAGATIYGDSSEYNMGGSELFKTATEDGGINGYLDVFVPFASGASDWTRTVGVFNGYNAAASGWTYTYCAAQATATTSTPCLRVFSSGNVGDASITGYIRVYGYKDS